MKSKKARFNIGTMVAIFALLIGLIAFSPHRTAAAPMNNVDILASVANFPSTSSACNADAVLSTLKPAANTGPQASVNTHIVANVNGNDYKARAATAIALNHRKATVAASPHIPDGTGVVHVSHWGTCSGGASVV